MVKARKTRTMKKTMGKARRGLMVASPLLRLG
jgi:hypothetical protein